MQRISLIIIAWIMNTGCLYSQVLPDLTEVELLKGKVKKIKITYYHSDGERSKVISEYDSSGRMTFQINYYIKKNPHKEYFSYDSIGNVASHIYENNDGLQIHLYKYEYDNQERIISQLELWDGKFFRGYDGVVYNDDNLPTQYLLKHPYSSEQVFIRYANGNNNEKIRYIKHKKNPA